jgi:hypothetical protein
MDIEITKPLMTVSDRLGPGTGALPECGIYPRQQPRAVLNSGNSPIQGPYCANDHVSSYSSHEEKLVGPYKNVRVKHKMNSSSSREDYGFQVPSKYTGKSLTCHYTYVP